MELAQLPPLVQRSVQRLIRAFAPDQIVLFGSYAKGNAHAGSDVDMLIVTARPDTPESLNARQRRAHQLCADCFPRIDVVFASAEEVATASAASCLFLASILESGTVIYAISGRHQ
jgi:predicted nucleotidyltransferase